MTDAEKRDRPPFSAQIDPDSDLVMIYCGKRAWELARPAKDRVASLVFPYYRQPDQYRWPVDDKDVIIITDEPIFWHDKLVWQLFADGAKVVHLYGEQIPGELWTYDPSTRGTP